MTILRMTRGALLALAVLALPQAAAAADGFARSSGYLQAGPATRYPRIVAVRKGQAVDVHGCLSRYSWCDVTVAGERGWFSGKKIAFQHNGQLAALSTIGAIVGLSILSFDRTSYWDDNYRNRSWYEDRRWRDGGTVSPRRERRLYQDDSPRIPRTIDLPYDRFPTATPRHRPRYMETNVPMPGAAPGIEPRPRKDRTPRQQIQQGQDDRSSAGIGKHDRLGAPRNPTRRDDGRPPRAQNQQGLPAPQDRPHVGPCLAPGPCT